MLFNGNALRKIAGLVDVGAFEDGDVVGEELDRDRLKQQRDKRVAARHCDAAGKPIGVVSPSCNYTFQTKN